MFPFIALCNLRRIQVTTSIPLYKKEIEESNSLQNIIETVCIYAIIFACQSMWLSIQIFWLPG